MSTAAIGSMRDGVVRVLLVMTDGLVLASSALRARLLHSQEVALAQGIAERSRSNDVLHKELRAVADAARRGDESLPADDLDEIFGR